MSSVSAADVTAALASLQARCARLVTEASADLRKAATDAAHARIDDALKSRGGAGGESTAKSMRVMAAREKFVSARPGAEIVLGRISRARERVISTKLGAASRYVASGTLSMARKVLAMPKAELRLQLKDLAYLRERLDKVAEPLSAQTWQDSVESWLALADLLPKLRGERAVAVLECVFADPGVVEALNAGMFFLHTNGVAPDSLMVILKQGLGKHIKANAYSYRQAVDREEARIQRILDLKDRAFQAIWAVFAAAWIAVFGFIGRIAWAEWGGDIVGEVLASSSAAD